MESGLGAVWQPQPRALRRSVAARTSSARALRWWVKPRIGATATVKSSGYPCAGTTRRVELRRRRLRRGDQGEVIKELGAAADCPWIHLRVNTRESCAAQEPGRSK